MARGERLRALQLARENLEHAHCALCTSAADDEMRRWARRVALLIEQMEEKIADERMRQAQEGAEELAALYAHPDEEERE